MRMTNEPNRFARPFRRAIGFALGFIVALPELGPKWLFRLVDRPAMRIQSAMSGDYCWGWYAGYDCVADFASRKHLTKLD
ncbi:MAG: hypothetical protein R3E21_08035 [Caenibius sp.]